MELLLTSLLERLMIESILEEAVNAFRATRTQATEEA